MAIVPVTTSYVSLVEIEDIGDSVKSLMNLLESQKNLYHNQIEELQRIVVRHCTHTGVNPLAQETAAGALSIKIGKKPRDLLNPKAAKYMQSLFSIKDTIGKKETREISALCGITVTQVRDYFASQRSKVRKLIRLSQEKATSDASKETIDEFSSTLNQLVPSTTNELVVIDSPDNRVIENCTPISSNSGTITSVSSQSPLTPEDVNCSSTHLLGNSSNDFWGFTQVPESSGDVLTSLNTEFLGCSENFNTVCTQIPWNLENSTQGNLGNFDDLYTPIAWCPGSTTNVSRNITNVSRNITNVSSNITNVSTNITNVSANATNASTNITKNVVNVIPVQDGPQQFPVKTNPKPVEEESTPGVDNDDKKFLESIFSLMRKEETFSGRVKLMEWVLQIYNSAVLSWFSTKGGITILATWLNEAALEEQTTVLHVVFKVLDHLPLNNALPVQMSSILQTVNRLRFYRNPDISDMAKTLLSKWSNMFVRSQLLKCRKFSKNRQLRQRTNGALDDKSTLDIPEEILAFAQGVEDMREAEPKNELKLLTDSSDASTRKHERSFSATRNKERRKVQLVEHPDNKTGRSFSVAKAVPSNQSRPISADDIQKAKRRAMHMQEKHGKSNTPPTVTRNSPQNIENNKTTPAFKIPQLPQLTRNETQKSPQERLLEDVKRAQIRWRKPAEVKINLRLPVCCGEDSKELQAQIKRNQRERETIYQIPEHIPPNPKEPWDAEVDYDDSLTPEIPIEQQPESESLPDEIDNEHENRATNEVPHIVDVPGADPELLVVLLKNPEVVNVLTREGMNMSQERLVALLDLVKTAGTGVTAVLDGLTNGSIQLGPISIPEPQPVSLPSPTPPSDATRSNWRSAFQSHASINPFSHGRSAPIVHAFSPPSTSHNMIPVGNNNQIATHMVITNNHNTPNVDHALPHRPPASTYALIQQSRTHETSSNFYQVNAPFRPIHTHQAPLTSTPCMHYSEPRPNIADFSRREYIPQSNRVLDDRANGINYYANQNNSNNSSINAYPRRNEYAPRIGRLSPEDGPSMRPPEMYGRDYLEGRREYEQSQRYYGEQNYFGGGGSDRRWWDPHR